MKNRAIKLIICICVVSCLMVGFCTAFASAEPAWLIRAKAGIAAAMFASNLFINPVNYALDDALAEGIDPAGYVLNIQETPWELYLEQSTIKVVPDTVYIDGVPYTDIWLGPEAADSLRLAGLDFASAYNILSNQSEAITYATGTGYLGDVPIYNVNGTLRSQGYQSDALSTVQSGSLTANIFDLSGHNNVRVTNTSTGNSVQSANLSVASTYPVTYLDYRMFGRLPVVYFIYNNNEGWNQTLYIDSIVSYNSDPFSFDYTSGVIDVPLDPEDGLLLRIPSEYTSQSAPQYNYDIHDLINIYPQVTQEHGAPIEIDPDLNPDFQTDIDLSNNVGDLIRIILSILDLLDNTTVEFAPEPAGPEPEPQPGQIDPLPDPDPAPEYPVAGTTIADTDWTKLDEILRWIQSTIDSIRHITESLQTMLDSLFDQMQDIIQALQELPEQLLEDIETGPSKVFRKALDVLKSLFMPLLLPIKAMMNLWHYVVEWIQSISSSFTWIFGVMSGTSYNMVLPIYAVLAGSICIAIYKALGR